MSDFRLKVFQSVAKNLSFTKASQEMLLSQPAVTRHIHELESQYQIRLFDRQGSRISLTEAGRLFLDHSERILDAYKKMEYEIGMLRGDYSGRLRLGASTTVEQYVVPLFLGEFIRKFPKISVSLLNGNSRFIETALQDNRIDLGIVEGIVRLPQLKYTSALDDELVAVVDAHGELASLPDEISLHRLEEIPLVLREQGSGTLDVIERSLLSHNIRLSQLKVMMYMGSTESIKRFCLRNSCMGIVSVRSVTEELMNGQLRVIDIPEMPMKREFSFVQCQGQEHGLAELFMQFALSRSLA